MAASLLDTITSRAGDSDWESTMESVFLLWYIRAAETENETEILIGAYSSEQEAIAAIDRSKDKPGFVDNVAGFHISRYELNKDQWTEGFLISD